ncbi:cysteine peptidase family C39 domain-containing protein [Aporhodopirellula aestuarii]|uniref:Peptidase C39 n=1 Tax=Aporhodopirellula aestuarii TaxID=2950107 RepID=A0ABT0U8Y9_9BACT|nr:peptidase C39 [Aporhodopirellula aestuarii]MCM2373000.1 peptidase C39 [Aporhodopirellula aestuarii]
MTDLWIAILVMVGVSIASGLFAGGYAYASKGQLTILYLSLAIVGMIYFLLYASGQLYWARIVPSSAAIIYTNLAAVFAALAAGWAFRLPKTPLWRRTTLATLLAACSMAAIVWPLLSIAVRPPPAGSEVPSGPVVMQTSWATCSPAAAATLLRAEGIEASEAEMIPLCLTDSSGTPTLGLYRGVKIKAQQQGREVDIVNQTLDELLDSNDWPVLLAVGLPYGVEDRRYAEQWGWIPGMGHSVVALAASPDGEGIVVADPSVGMERWSRADLSVLWRGVGMRITGGR